MARHVVVFIAVSLQFCPAVADVLPHLDVEQLPIVLGLCVLHIDVVLTPKEPEILRLAVDYGEKNLVSQTRVSVTDAGHARVCWATASSFVKPLAPGDIEPLCATNALLAASGIGVGPRLPVKRLIIASLSRQKIWPYLADIREPKPINAAISIDILTPDAGNVAHVITGKPLTRWLPVCRFSATM